MGACKQDICERREQMKLTDKQKQAWGMVIVIILSVALFALLLLWTSDWNAGELIATFMSLVAGIKVVVLMFSGLLISGFICIGWLFVGPLPDPPKITPHGWW